MKPRITKKPVHDVRDLNFDFTQRLKTSTSQQRLDRKIMEPARSRYDFCLSNYLIHPIAYVFNII